MRLGTIESANGDAVLTVADGSFVDAYNEDSVGLSDSAAKVDRWLENGLISSADADDSSSQAAEDAKAERLAGLDSRAELWLAVKQVKFRLIKMQLRLMPMMVICRQLRRFISKQCKRLTVSAMRQKRMRR
ncbi:MAG: hypothetical protein ACLR2G_00085 [Phascolarctobacterium faecium]